MLSYSLKLNISDIFSQLISGILGINKFVYAGHLVILVFSFPFVNRIPIESEIIMSIPVVIFLLFSVASCKAAYIKINRMKIKDEKTVILSTFIVPSMILFLLFMSGFSIYVVPLLAGVVLAESVLFYICAELVSDLNERRT